MDDSLSEFFSSSDDEEIRISDDENSVSNSSMASKALGSLKQSSSSIKSEGRYTKRRQVR